MPCLLESIRSSCPDLQTEFDAVIAATTMDRLIGATWTLSCALGVRIIEAVLEARAVAPVEWPTCPECGQRLNSRGRVKRHLTTRLVVIRWRRPMARCPYGCSVPKVAPLDDALGLTPVQRTSTLLKQGACLLTVFVPFGTAVAILGRLFPAAVCSSSSVWNWVQESGRGQKPNCARISRSSPAASSPPPTRYEQRSRARCSWSVPTA